MPPQMQNGGFNQGPFGQMGGPGGPMGMGGPGMGGGHVNPLAQQMQQMGLSGNGMSSLGPGPGGPNGMMPGFMGGNQPPPPPGPPPMHAMSGASPLGPSPMGMRNGPNGMNPMMGGPGGPMGGGMMNQHNGSFGQLPTNGSYGNGLNLMGGPNGGGGASPGMMNQHNGSFGNLQQQQQSTIEGESEAYHKAIDGQLLTGLLCAALYPQIIAIEREETKKKKGINAPMKLRIRDKQEGVEIKEGELPEPTEVAIHPSSVNTKETKFNGMTCTRLHALPCLAFARTSARTDTGTLVF